MSLSAEDIRSPDAVRKPQLHKTRKGSQHRVKCMTQASLPAWHLDCCARANSSKTVMQFQNRPVCPHWLLSTQERSSSVIPFYGYRTYNQCFFLLRMDEKCWNLWTTPLENKGHLTRMYRPSRPRPFVSCYTRTHTHTHTYIHTHAHTHGMSTGIFTQITRTVTLQQMSFHSLLLDTGSHNEAEYIM